MLQPLPARHQGSSGTCCKALAIASTILYLEDVHILVAPIKRTEDRKVLLKYVGLILHHWESESHHFRLAAR
jgi:hypothetical protein